MSSCGGLPVAVPYWMTRPNSRTERRLFAECFHACELFIGRRRPEHFNVQNVSDLHRRRAHASGNGVNQGAMAEARPGRLCHARLPVGQIGREVVDGEGGGLFVGPMLGDDPEPVRMSTNLLG